MLLGVVFALLMQLGLDIQFMLQWSGFLLSFTPLVIAIAAGALVLALFLAVVVALGRLSQSPTARAFASLIVSVIRGTPLIVQIFFIFVALPQLAAIGPGWLKDILVLDPVLTAILAIGIFHGGYIAEILRAGFVSVSAGQWEAASAIGMTTAQIRRRIIWPQAIKFALRPTANHFVMLQKDTALVGFLGVAVLFQRAQLLGSQNLKFFEAILIAAAIYWVLSTITLKLINRIDASMLKR